MNPARTEEITPERVIAKGWYRCLVYERYVVLQSGPTDSPHDFAVKARGPDLDAACRWKGPFLFARQTGEPSHLRYFFVGMFRDSVLYKVFHDGAEFILHDLPARKERLRYIYGHADDEPRYEGNGRFTWWTPVSHVASGGASEKACNQHLRDALVKLKAEHRPLYDGLAPEPCWRPMNLDYSEPGSPSCDRFAWWGRFELDLRNPRPRRLPELRCGWMSAL